MADSIFTKIIRGEIPCHKIYEDAKSLAFLDINRGNGHTLVVPKKQVQFIWDLDDEDYRALSEAVKKVGLRIREVMGQPYVGQAVSGIDVPHTHVHVFPFADSEEFYRQQDTTIETDHAALAEVAKKLAF